MPVSSNVPHPSFRHHRVYVSQEKYKLKRNIGGGRQPMENITNIPLSVWTHLSNFGAVACLISSQNSERNREPPRAGVTGEEHLDSASPISSHIPFTLPTLPFSLEKEFWEVHDIRPLGDVCQTPRTYRPTWSDIRIRSVTHPNSPYVPWPEHQRQCILASAETLGNSEAVPCGNSKEWVGVSDVETTPPPASRQGSLRRKVFDPIMKCFRSLYSSIHIPSSTPHISLLNSVGDSTATLSSVETTSLEDWLAERQLETPIEDVIRTTKAYYTSLDEYERNGSWAHRAPSTDVSDNSHNPALLHSASHAFSVDCVPSPSPTIISFPYFPS